MNTLSAMTTMHCPTPAEQEAHKALEIPGVRIQDALEEYIRFLTKASPQLAKMSTRTFVRRRANCGCATRPTAGHVRIPL